MRLMPRLEIQIHDSHSVLQKSKLMWKLVVNHIQNFFEIMNQHKRDGHHFKSKKYFKIFITHNLYSKHAHKQLPHKIKDYNLFAYKKINE